MISGQITSKSDWAEDCVIVSGDSFAVGNSLTGVRISVPRDLTHRKLYVCGVVIPSVTSGYQVSATSTAKFILAAKNERQDFLRWEWDNPNTTGIAFPTVASTRIRCFSQLRPGFRMMSRSQVQPFMQGWDAGLEEDGVEMCFRTTATGPMGEAVEWLVKCAPFRFQAQVNEITIDVQNSTSIAPDQIFMCIGCLSSEVLQ